MPHKIQRTPPNDPGVVKDLPPAAPTPAVMRAREAPTGLVGAIDAALTAMSWLTAADTATVALARSYATAIDDAAASGDEGLAAKALYLGPHLLNTLRALGGTPADRKALGVEEVTRGRLAELRSIRGG